MTARGGRGTRPTQARPKRAFLVGKRRPGRDIGGAIREARTLLRKAGWEVDSKVALRKKELDRLTAAAVKVQCDVVVAVGGDGIVVRVAGSLLGTPVALGIIPTGTGNLLAGNLRIPHGATKAARILLTGRTRQVDLGQLTVEGKDRIFAVACGIGFDAEVMDATGSAQKLRWGKVAYLANALGQTGTIANAPHEIMLDGVVTTMEAAQVFIANFGKMLPVVEPRRKIRPDDGLLDVIVVRSSGPLPGLLASWEVMLQTKLGESHGGRIFRAQAREVRIESQPGRLVEIDGDVVGRTPVVAKVLPAVLRVMVPAK